jgi:C4-dicarboxylate transporter, DctM subunit
MTPLEIGLIALVGMIVLICVGVPLAFAIGAVAIIGNVLLVGLQPTSVQLYQSAFQTTTEFLMTSIPLFILMGQLVSAGGLGRDIYSCVYKWLGWVPGGLAVTTVSSCAALGAVTGISSAALGALAPIAIPEMKRYGYSSRLAAGSLASASTLAILIPPSLAFVIYGIWTETSIGRLFAAGVVPGLMLAAMFCVYIVTVCLINPKLGPTGPSFTWRERLTSTGALLPIFLIFIGMLAGLYAGWFTPSEGAAVGCSAVFVLLLVMGRLNPGNVAEALKSTAALSVMIFAIVIAVQLFSRFLVMTDVPERLVAAIGAAGLSRYVVLAAIILLYVFLGMILDSIGMVLLTLPFVFPIIKALGFDPVWFGIILTVMIEVGQLTPPVGLNCYILNRMTPEIPLGDIFAGVMPFVVICMVAVLLFTIFPQIVLWLPNLMFG